MLSERLANSINKKPGDFVKLRKAKLHEAEDDFGTWGVDEVGKYRKNVVGSKAAYHLPSLSKEYRKLYKDRKKS